MRKRSNSGTIKISLVYGLVFILWIVFRNKIFYLWGKSDVTYTSGQTTIDIFFGFFTALSIYFLIQYFKSQLIKETGQLKNIIDNTTALIFTKSPDSKFTFINKQLENLIKVKREKIIGKSDKELWPKEVADKFLANDREVLEKGKPITYEEYVPHKDGPHTYLTVKFPIRDLSGKIYAMGGVATDITEQKRIEKELKHTLSLSEATLESTADGILVVSSDGKTISNYNQNFVKMWHIPPEILKSRVDKQVLKYVTAKLKDPETFLSKVKELYGSPEKESFDILELADGRTFERYSKPQISEDEIIGRVWSFRDVTEIKKAKEADKKRIEQSNLFQDTILKLTQLEIGMSLQEKLDKIIEMTAKATRVERVSIWQFDDSQNYLHTNKIYNLSTHTFIPGTTIYVKDFPVYYETIDKYSLINANDAVNDPRTSEFTEFYLSPLGITSMMDCAIRVGGKMIGVICMEHVGHKREWTHEEQVFSSSIAGLIAVSTEHEQRQQAELKIRQSEEKYRFLAETVPQLIWTAQPDGAVDYYNSNMFEYTGRKLEELTEWKWESIVHPDDLSNTVKTWKDSLQQIIPLRIEVRLRGKDKSYRWYLVMAVPQKDDSGAVMKWFGSATDINEQKENSEALKTKNEELKKINNDLDNFIYTASHDLKAPISNIEGLLNMLKSDETSKNDDIQTVLGLMEKSTERFKQTIETLTDIAKTQRDINEDIEEVNFEDIFNEVLPDIKEIGKSKAKIKTDFQVSSIKFSKKNMRSIIYNLISNAIKYRNPDVNPEVSVSTESNNGYTKLTVKDNGMGIDKNNQDKVFKMFKRFNTTIEGTGIGLYIVKRIMDNNDGKIKLESEINKGTSFILYFKN